MKYYVDKAEIFIKYKVEFNFFFSFYFYVLKLLLLMIKKKKFEITVYKFISLWHIVIENILLFLKGGKKKVYCIIFAHRKICISFIFVAIILIKQVCDQTFVFNLFFFFCLTLYLLEYSLNIYLVKNCYKLLSGFQ